MGREAEADLAGVVCPVGNTRSEERFMDDGGIEAVLDLLDCCPLPMRYQVHDLERWPS